jgi:hypothetical protein
MTCIMSSHRYWFASQDNKRYTVVPKSTDRTYVPTYLTWYGTWYVLFRLGNSVVNTHWFEFGSGFIILGKCRSESRYILESRVLMTKNN